MSDTTLLDTARAAMTDGGDTAERAYFARLADTELFLLLENEAQGDTLTPRIFALEEGPVVLAFDREDRLSGFAGGAAPYAAVSGRALVRMLVGGGDTGLGLGLNLGHASALLLPADGVAWLAEALDVPLAEAEARIAELSSPRGVPDALLQALDGHLARAGGLARCAWLAGARYDGGGQGHLVAFQGVAPGAEATLARTVAEALRFSGLDAGALDVVFPPEDAPLWARIARVGLRFDLPEAERAATPAAPPAPGSDPDRPPRLR